MMVQAISGLWSCTLNAKASLLLARPFAFSLIALVWKHNQLDLAIASWNGQRIHQDGHACSRFVIKAHTNL